MSSQQFSARARARARRGGPVTSQGSAECQRQLWEPGEHSRTSDPATSKLAAKYMAESGAAETMLGIAYRALLKRGGYTAKELEQAAGYSDGAIRKRLTDLKTRGLAYTGMDRICSITGMRSQTWYAVRAS